MTTVRVTLRTSKINKAGEAPLSFRITQNRKSQHVSLGIRLEPKYWNEQRQRVKPSYPTASRLNNFIKKKIAQVHTEALLLESEGDFIDADTIRGIVTGNKKGKKAVNFFDVADGYIKELKLQNKVGTYRRYKSTINKFAKFYGSKNLPIRRITVSLLKKYSVFAFEDRGNKPNTVNANLRTIRRIINVAIEEDLFPLEKSPFLKMKLPREKVNKVYLTEEELKRIENLELKKNTWRELARNTFVFSSYCAGLRLSDVVLLQWKHFNGTHINKNTKKTNTPISVKLPTKVKDILDRYFTEEAKPEDYVFPLLRRKIDPKNHTAIFNGISNSNTQVNKELVKIAKLTEIDKHISFHTSRHTFATRALRKGMRIEYVSKLMGHASIKTTQVYTKIVNEELDKAMDIFDDEEE